MAVVFADPFGSYIEGLQEGQKFEQEYQEHAFETFDDSMRLLDDLVLAPQRALAKEQRQYARQLDLMMRRHQLARQRAEESTLSRQLDERGGTSLFGGAFRISQPGSGRPPAPEATPLSQDITSAIDQDIGLRYSTPSRFTYGQSAGLRFGG